MIESWTQGTVMKKILFVCVGNACRSQMAEGFTKKYGSPMEIEAFSVGTMPAAAIDPMTVRVMAETGIDVTGYCPKPIDGEHLVEFDRIISMGPGVRETCPFLIIRERAEDWGIRDPVGRGLDFFRKTRDEIRDRVLAMLEFI